MKRRKILMSILLATTMLMSLGACGSEKRESGKKVYKVGIVQYVDDASLNQIESSIEKELDEKGKEKNVVFEYKKYKHNGQADASNLNQIATELVNNEVDIIIPIATPAAMICQNATEDKDIPIVFSAVSDPVSSKLVKSLEKPSGNITGTSDALDTKTLFKVIRAGSDVKKLGLLYNKSEDSSIKAIKEIKQLCKKNGIEVVEKTGTTTNEIALCADALIENKVDAVFTPTDNTVQVAEISIYDKFQNAKIPHYAGADSFALNGAFCGYGINYVELGKKTADIAVDILVEKKKPSQIPVQFVNSGIATVNTETAEKIGLDYSKFKDLCTQVIETKTKKEFD
ncbi:ABC transporter substrate-binding protein [Lachnobacterium bovis]|uniref:Putative ABC transport system substrate-binding protein n=1 Tax=Lachnobacterium bovis TaxID=140626 RepID=A0A1H9QIJ6_9FIRM|nr:ABC transporter substrate-binding protein [Lachnobacterium bovis]SER59669.1 putative ABC transport system substrate-binding protein [Lachnobacterium bovis]